MQCIPYAGNDHATPVTASNGNQQPEFDANHGNPVIAALRESLPPVFSRKVAAEHLKGVISAASLANMDSRGQGASRMLIGGKIAYERETFLAWLMGRMETTKTSEVA